MIGDLHETPKGWSLQPPTMCANGHPLGPHQVLVGHQPCTCRGSHLSWSCRECGDTFFWPPTDPMCSVLHGAGHNRPPI